MHRDKPVLLSFPYSLLMICFVRNLMKTSNKPDLEQSMQKRSVMKRTKIIDMEIEYVLHKSKNIGKKRINNWRKNEQALPSNRIKTVKIKEKEQSDWKEAMPKLLIWFCLCSLFFLWCFYVCLDLHCLYSRVHIRLHQTFETCSMCVCPTSSDSASDISKMTDFWTIRVKPWVGLPLREMIIMEMQVSHPTTYQSHVCEISHKTPTVKPPTPRTA